MKNNNQQRDVQTEIQPNMRRFFDVAKKASLSHTEKNNQLQALQMYMHDNPIAISHIKRPYTSHESSLWSQIFFAGPAKYATLALALIILVGSGTAYASQSALPGDLLYPVKINVTEKAETFLSFSTKSQAEIALIHATKRLEEVETLAAQGKLGTVAQAKIQGEVQTNFKNDADQVAQSVTDLKAQGDVTGAAEVASNFESSLSSHQTVLAGLAKDQTQSSNNQGNNQKENIARNIAEQVPGAIATSGLNPVMNSASSTRTIQDIATSTESVTVSASTDLLASLTGAVTAHLAATATARASAEETIATSTDEVKVKTSAEDAFTSSVLKIAEAKNILEGLGSTTIDVDLQMQATAKLEAAKEDMAQGKARFDAGFYGDAYLLYKKAGRGASEVKITLQTKGDIDSIQQEINKKNTTDGNDGNNKREKNATTTVEMFPVTASSTLPAMASTTLESDAVDIQATSSLKFSDKIKKEIKKYQKIENPQDLKSIDIKL